MTALLEILLALNVLVPVGIALRMCVKRQGIEFDHLLMFTVGYLFYWILPIGIGVLHGFRSEPAMSLWYRVFDVIRPEALAWYLVIALGCYLSFAAGSILSARWFRRRNTVYKPTFFYSRLLDSFLIIGLLAAAAYALVLRGEFFQGYAAWDATGEGVEKRGPFIAWSLFLLALALIAASKRQEDSGFTAPFGALLRSRYFVCYFGVAVLVLSLGGRLYFVSSLVMLLVYRSVYFQRVSGRLALGVCLSVVLLSALIGLTRLNADLSAQSALLNVFMESLFTSFSLIHFLGDAIFEWIKFPIFLISGAINLVPTVFIPDKAKLIVSPEDYGYVAYSPVGALNSYFSFMINFGILGTVAFLFLFACFLNYLKLQDRRLFYRVIYVMLTGWIGFTFFRDDFSISLIKSMFQFSLLVPVVIVLALQLLSVFLRDLRRPRNAAPPLETEPPR